MPTTETITTMVDGQEIEIDVEIYVDGSKVSVDADGDLAFVRELRGLDVIRNVDTESSGALFLHGVERRSREVSRILARNDLRILDIDTVGDDQLYLYAVPSDSWLIE